MVRKDDTARQGGGATYSDPAGAAASLTLGGREVRPPSGLYRPRTAWRRMRTTRKLGARKSGRCWRCSAGGRLTGQGEAGCGGGHTGAFWITPILDHTCLWKRGSSLAPPLPAVIVWTSWAAPISPCSPACIANVSSGLRENCVGCAAAVRPAPLPLTTAWIRRRGARTRTGTVARMRMRRARMRTRTRTRRGRGRAQSGAQWRLQRKRCLAWRYPLPALLALPCPALPNPGLPNQAAAAATATAAAAGTCPPTS